MENNLRKKFKNTKGITLIALVITIIVLLILAGVSLSMVLSQDGIFSRAEKATNKYGQAKARETLELVLDEFQITKYEEGLSGQNYENRLDSKIAEVGSLLPKEDENSNNQLVIVEGHIFEIDRSVPKIVDYKGPADGVIITARVTQNGDWKNPVATVTGTITKYGGGTITSSTATAKVISTGSTSTITEFPTTGGTYTISSITEDTDITITASSDDEKPAVTETIEVRLVRDTTPPIISDAKAESKSMKIKISAKAVDTESGLASFKYSVSPATKEDGTATVKDNKAEGDLDPNGTPVEIETTEPGDYTVTFTAIDNATKTATATAGPVKTTDAISIAELKRILKADASKYPDYLGMKVDYNPTARGTWRVFYYDVGDATHPNGFFGDGAGTIYLKRDVDYEESRALSDYGGMTNATAKGLSMMKKLNPDWADKDGVANLTSEKAVAGLCDTDNWAKYCDTNVARYAIGAAPLEMWTKAQNVYKNKYDTSASTIGCGWVNENGYGYTINKGTLVEYKATTVVSTSKEQSKVIATESSQWLASPSFIAAGNLCHVSSDQLAYWDCGYSLPICPVVSLKD